MEIHFTIRAVDAIALARFLQQKKAPIARRIFARRTAFAAIFAALAISLWFSGGMNSILWVIVSLAFLLYFVSPLYTYQHLQNWANDFTAQLRAQGIAEVTLRATPDGLEHANKLGTSNLRWQWLSDFILTPDHLFISTVATPNASLGWSLAVPKAQVGAAKLQQFTDACLAYKYRGGPKRLPTA